LNPDAQFNRQTYSRWAKMLERRRRPTLKLQRACATLAFSRDQLAGASTAPLLDVRLEALMLDFAVEAFRPGLWYPINGGIQVESTAPARLSAAG
jgi:hypothetical protein